MADRAALQPRTRLEERYVLQVQVDPPARDMQSAQYLLARPLIDLIAIEVQPQNMLDDLVDRNRKVDNDTCLRLVLADAGGCHFLNHFVPQELQRFLAHRASSSR